MMQLLILTMNLYICLDSAPQILQILAPHIMRSIILDLTFPFGSWFRSFAVWASGSASARFPPNQRQKRKATGAHSGERVHIMA